MKSDFELIKQQLGAYGLGSQYKELLIFQTQTVQELLRLSSPLGSQVARIAEERRALVKEAIGDLSTSNLVREIETDLGFESIQSLAQKFSIDKFASAAAYGQSLLDTAREQAAEFGSIASAIADAKSGFGELGLSVQSLGGIADIFVRPDFFKDIAAQGFMSLVAEGYLEGGQDAESEDEPDSKILLPDDYRRGLIEFRGVPMALIKLIRDDPEQMDRWIEDPLDFERLVAQLLDESGAEEVFLTPRSGDGGIDVFAIYQRKGSRVLLACECKKYRRDRKVSVQNANAFIGALVSTPGNPEIGILAATSGFGPGAARLLAQRVEVKGGIQLHGWGPREIGELVRTAEPDFKLQ